MFLPCSKHTSLGLVERPSADLLQLGLFTCMLTRESIPHAPTKLTVKKGLHSQSVRILVSWQSQSELE